MDFLPLALAMSGCFGGNQEPSTETIELLDSIESKIIEQAKILCQKENLSSDDMSMLSLCHSIISTIKEREKLKAQKQLTEKEIKEKLADLIPEYNVKP